MLDYQSYGNQSLRKPGIKPNPPNKQTEIDRRNIRTPSSPQRNQQQQQYQQPQYQQQQQYQQPQYQQPPQQSYGQQTHSLGGRQSTTRIPTQPKWGRPVR